MGFFRAIRLSWVCFAYPCFLLAYIGQAAYITVDPTAVSNPFFNTILLEMYRPSLVLSILAAIVVLQAIIAVSAQLISHAMSPPYFSGVNLVHAPERFHGQPDIPLATWPKMIGTVIATVVYYVSFRPPRKYHACRDLTLAGNELGERVGCMCDFRGVHLILPLSRWRQSSSGNFTP